MEYSSLIPSINQLKAYAESFAGEIRLAEQGKKSSLSFLRNPLNEKKSGKPKDIQVMVLGGTTFSTAIVTEKGGKLELSPIEQQPLPKFSTKEVLLDFIVKNLAPEEDFLALNFAYPLQPQERDGRLDAVLLRGTKEHEFEGLVGEYVGQTIEDHVWQQTGKSIKVSLANDAACMVLAGLTMAPAGEALAAGISGTGCNFALMLPGKTVVNLESGNFSKVEQSSAGKEIDRDSTSPGTQLFEKEVTGGYLFQHYNYWLEKLSLPGRAVNSTYELSKLAAEGNEFARVLFQRSAALFSIQVAGVYKYLGESELNLVMDGSLFWSGYGYQYHVKNYLKQLGVADEAVKMLLIPNRSILGAAKLIY